MAPLMVRRTHFNEGCVQDAALDKEPTHAQPEASRKAEPHAADELPFASEPQEASLQNPLLRQRSENMAQMRKRVLGTRQGTISERTGNFLVPSAPGTFQESPSTMASPASVLITSHTPSDEDTHALTIVRAEGEDHPPLSRRRSLEPPFTPGSTAARLHAKLSKSPRRSNLSSPGVPLSSPGTPGIPPLSPFGPSTPPGGSNMPAQQQQQQGVLTRGAGGTRLRCPAPRLPRSTTLPEPSFLDELDKINEEQGSSATASSAQDCKEKCGTSRGTRGVAVPRPRTAGPYTGPGKLSASKSSEQVAPGEEQVDWGNEGILLHTGAAPKVSTKPDKQLLAIQLDEILSCLDSETESTPGSSRSRVTPPSAGAELPRMPRQHADVAAAHLSIADFLDSLDEDSDSTVTPTPKSAPRNRSWGKHSAFPQQAGSVNLDKSHDTSPAFVRAEPERSKSGESNSPQDVRMWNIGTSARAGGAKTDTKSERRPKTAADAEKFLKDRGSSVEGSHRRMASAHALGRVSLTSPMELGLKEREHKGEGEVEMKGHESSSLSLPRQACMDRGQARRPSPAGTAAKVGGDAAHSPTQQPATGRGLVGAPEPQHRAAMLQQGGRNQGPIQGGAHELGLSRQSSLGRSSQASPGGAGCGPSTSGGLCRQSSISKGEQVPPGEGKSGNRKPSGSLNRQTSIGRADQASPRAGRSLSEAGGVSGSISSSLQRQSSMGRTSRGQVASGAGVIWAMSQSQKEEVRRRRVRQSSMDGSIQAHAWGCSGLDQTWGPQLQQGNAGHRMNSAGQGSSRRRSFELQPDVARAQGAAVSQGRSDLGQVASGQGRVDLGQAVSGEGANGKRSDFALPRSRSHGTHYLQRPTGLWGENLDRSSSQASFGEGGQDLSRVGLNPAGLGPLQMGLAVSHGGGGALAEVFRKSHEALPKSRSMVRSSTHANSPQPNRNFTAPRECEKTMDGSSIAGRIDQTHAQRRSPDVALQRRPLARVGGFPMNNLSSAVGGSLVERTEPRRSGKGGGKLPAKSPGPLSSLPPGHPRRLPRSRSTIENELQSILQSMRQEGVLPQEALLQESNSSSSSSTRAGSSPEEARMKVSEGTGMKGEVERQGKVPGNRQLDESRERATKCSTACSSGEEECAAQKSLLLSRAGVVKGGSSPTKDESSATPNEIAAIPLGVRGRVSARLSQAAAAARARVAAERGKGGGENSVQAHSGQVSLIEGNEWANQSQVSVEQRRAMLVKGKHMSTAPSEREASCNLPGLKSGRTSSDPHSCISMGDFISRSAASGIEERWGRIGITQNGRSPGGLNQLSQQ